MMLEKQGTPNSTTCRWCGLPKIVKRGIFFCSGSCDEAERDGIKIRGTWRSTL